MRSRAAAAVVSALAVLLAVAAWPASRAVLAPARAPGTTTAQTITGGTFGVATKYTVGTGDTWFSTWGTDGNLYVTSDDTKGFNFTCNSDLSVNELAGNDPTQLTEPYLNCMTSYGPRGDLNEYPDGCDWKTSGIISVSGTLYLVVNRQTGVCTESPYGEQPSIDASIVKSTDDGRTWSNGFGSTDDPGGAAPPPDTATGHVMAMFPGQSFSAPFFIQYGQDDNPAGTADGGDQYVYAISNEGFAYDGSYLYLGRVLRSQIGSLDAADWQYYDGPPGGDGMNSADWTSSFSDARPILTAVHQISQPDVEYVPALHRYILISFYYPFSPTWPENGTASSSTFDFFEAPHPWGPWTRFFNKPSNLTVCYGTCQSDSTIPLGLYSPGLAPKFTRMDGLSNDIFTSGDFVVNTRYDDTKMYYLHTLPFTLSVPGLAAVDDQSSAITYSGSWTDSTYQTLGTDYFDGTDHYTDTPGDSASFTFTGRSVQWIGTTGDDYGEATVSVDGGPSVTADAYSHDLAHQVTLFTRTGLSPGRHTITITDSSDKDPSSSGTYVDVDAFVVGR